MDIFNQQNIGKFLTIAGAIVTVAGSLIELEQQKQANHEIAQEVAALVCAELAKGGIR